MDPDIIGVTESWAHSEVFDGELTLSGYDLFRKDRLLGRRGGGVLLYHHHHHHQRISSRRKSYKNFRAAMCHVFHKCQWYCCRCCALLYVKSELCAAEHKPASKFPEQVWCRITSSRISEALVGVLYRTPTSDIYGGGNHDALIELLEEVNGTGKQFVLMGGL